MNSRVSRLQSARLENIEYNDALVMNHNTLRTIPSTTRVLLSFLWGSVCAVALAAPWLASHGHARGAALVYAFFSPVCHQDPARSFAWLGHPWAVCHRCSGIYAALFLTSLWPYEFSFLLSSPRRRRIWVVAATLPLLLDFLAPLAGLWTNTPGSRLITGLLFGVMLSSLLGPAIAEYVHEVRNRIRSVESDALGGLL